MADGNQVGRAPNEKFYAVWRDHLICSLDGVTAYFDTEREAWDYLRQCDTAGQLLDLGTFAA